ncbi:MAG: c-type cytochrome [Archangium sp.]|nr:c-type cytochrome [Archangium sp.]MDP3157323.1 c-type cytochrome [Archangium sp.]MDP3571161.1 c-type cytochrome [Archangium sp.]
MNFFKRSMLLGAVAAAISFSSCTPPNSGASARASGSLALSNDDKTVFAVDTDNGMLAVINPATPDDVRLVPVGKNPVRVIVAPDDTVFVANNGDRSVSVVRKGDTAESARIPVGVEPSGMAMTSDGKTLLVVSATGLDRTDEGTLTSIDTATLQKNWELSVGEEPRAVAIIAGNRALVSLFKTGELVEVDLEKGTKTSSKTGIYETANATRVSGVSSPAPVSTFRPRAMADLIVTAQGDRVFAPVVWAREDAIGRRPSTSGGYYAAGGPCNIGAVATAGIVTVDTGSTPQPQVDDLTSCFSAGTNSAEKDFPASTLASSASGASAFQGPIAGVLDPTGTWLYVLNRETRNLAIMPAWKRSGVGIDFETTGTSVRTVQNLEGHGADGLAITADGSRVYVYSQFSHQLEIFDGQGRGAGAKVVTRPSVRNVAPEKLSVAMAEGRKLFFNAQDLRMSSSSTNVACSTCHLDGREDGHVWQFPDGARQTPALAGRKLLSTAPYHWSGEFPSLNEFNVHTITERMGGSGLDPQTALKLDTFIDALPLPENPLRTAMSGPAELRGKAAFEKAACGTCHTGELFTNNTNQDVGTLRVGRGVTNPDNGVVMANGFNVPSLLGIGRSAPYLHDGSQLTLEERVISNVGDRHGVTSTLSLEEKNDLVAYLKSL